MDFGEGLRELRQQRKLGVNQLALQSGVSASQISRFENGHYDKPKPETLKKLATGLKVDEIVLMNLAGYLMPPTNVQVVPTSDGAHINVDNPNLDDDEVESYIKNLQETNPIVESDVKIPVYGQIHAGAPAFADQHIIGTTPVTQDLVERYGKENLFALQINGDSMSRVLPDGFTAIFVKRPSVENGDIVAVLIDGEDAAIKRFKETSLAVIFSPDSYNETYKPIVFPKTGEQDFKILGKYLYASSLPI